MATKTMVNISPKVLTGGLCGLGVAVAEAVAVSVTPHSLAFLGGWEPLAIGAVPILLGQVAAWLKHEEQALTAAPNPAPPAPPAGNVAPLEAATIDQIINGHAA